MTGSSAGQWGKSAYMLVYERQKKTDLTEVVISAEQEKLDNERISAYEAAYGPKKPSTSIIT